LAPFEATRKVAEDLLCYTKRPKGHYSLRRLSLLITFSNSFLYFESSATIMVKPRRSKRKVAVLNGLLQDHGKKLRRSARSLSKRKEEEKVYGQDYGILPSD
jgi:hypothetical protein